MNAGRAFGSWLCILADLADLTVGISQVSFLLMFCKFVSPSSVSLYLAVVILVNLGKGSAQSLSDIVFFPYCLWPVLIAFFGGVRSGNVPFFHDSSSTTSSI